jgi:ribose 5-phosphate isomerase RpiB
MEAPAGTGTVLWWCDGPCGPAKAAVVAQSKESPLRGIDLPADPRQLVPVIKMLAGEVRSGRASAGVLMVQSAATAAVYANRCPSLRAVVGTCMDAVEQGLRRVAANVLVIEHPYRTLHQVKSMVARFAKAKRDLPEDVRRQLEELTSCG